MQPQTRTENGQRWTLSGPMGTSFEVTCESFFLAALCRFSTSRITSAFDNSRTRTYSFDHLNWPTLS